MGGARQLNALRAACHRGEPGGGDGAHQHVPCRHGEDTDAGIPSEAKCRGGCRCRAARPRCQGPHARRNGHRRRVHPCTRGVLRRLRVLRGTAPRVRRRSTPAHARRRLRRCRDAGPRPDPHTARCGEAAAAVGTPQRSHGLPVVFVAPGRRSWLVPQLAHHFGHERAVHGLVGCGKRLIEEGLALGEVWCRRELLCRTSVLRLRGHQRGSCGCCHSSFRRCENADPDAVRAPPEPWAQWCACCNAAGWNLGDGKGHFAERGSMRLLPRPRATDRPERSLCGH
mmetsp:Transcript_58482/g.161846  ORF Transcript_58482/g.161846 Transcript_58482/m.161846 type:complete len:283 (+) Transcript_58482:118-966(+)